MAYMQTKEEKAAYAAQLRALKGDAFVDEVLHALAPDDLDGCFTVEGAVRYDLAQAELRRRMAAALKGEQ